MNKLSVFILSLAVGLSLCSCSIGYKYLGRDLIGKTNPNYIRVEKEEQTLEQVADQQTPAAVVEPAAPKPEQQAPEQAAPVSSAEEKAKPEEAIAKPAPNPVPAVPESKLAGKLNGEWVIISAGHFNIKQDEDMPYVIFDEKVHRFYASNGCNILNGNFKLQDTNYIIFSHVLSTLMACPDIEYESAINAVLRDGALIKADITAKGNEWYMRFRNSSDQVVMTLRKHNMETLNGQWQITHIGGQNIDIPDANIFFNISDLTVHGNTGCNHYNGTILIDPQVANSISFAQMDIEQKPCDNITFEMAMLVALEETTNYKLSGDTLHLLDQEGRTLITLHRHN